MASRPPAADEVFVNLLRVAREDPKIFKFLRALSGLADFERRSIINSMTTEMAFKGAPGEFIQAIAALRDPEISKKVQEFLKENDEK